MNKNYFLSFADMAADVAQTKQRRHMAAYEKDTCDTVYMCAHVWVHVCVINKNKHHFKDLC